MKRSNQKTASRAGKVATLAGWLLFASHSLAATVRVDISAKSPGNGSQYRPFSTIAAAIAVAKAGDIVLIAPGVYREAITVPAVGIKDKPLTVRGGVGVIVTGAVPLTDWEDEGGGVYSTPWTVDFAIDFKDGQPIRSHGADAPVGCAEQVSWRGMDLKQILKRGDLVAGQFCVDWEADRLYVRLPDDLDARNEPIEAAKLQQLLGPADEKSQYVTVEDIVFEHGATFAQRGMVVTGTRWVLNNVTARRASGCGVMIRGNDVVVRGVVAELNGQMGMGATDTKNTIIEGCTTRFNNTRGFNPDWEGGGGKYIKTTGLRIRQMRAYGNIGPGIWLDIDNKDYQLSNCVAYENVGWFDGTEPQRGTGIFTEINPGPGLIERCVTFDNTGTGITVAESEGVTVKENISVGNRAGFELRAMENRPPWKLENVTFIANQSAENKEAELMTTLGTWVPSSATGRKITMTDNVYAPNPGVPMARWGDVTVNEAADFSRLLGLDRTATLRFVELPGNAREMRRRPLPDAPKNGPPTAVIVERGDVTVRDGTANCIARDVGGQLLVLETTKENIAFLDALPALPIGQPRRIQVEPIDGGPIKRLKVTKRL